MKHLLVILSLFFLVSCGGSEDCDNSSDDQNTNTTTNTDVVDNDVDNSNTNTSADFNPDDCQQFLDDYEAWADEAIIAVKNAKSNPTDPQSMQKLMDVTNEMADWATRYMDLYGCSDDPDFQTRVKEIETKVDTELGE